MLFTDVFYFDIERIHIAHEFILDRAHRCEYPTGREHYGLVYVQSGKAEYHFFTGDRFVVREGDVLFLSPNCAYSIVTEKEFKHYTVNFDIHEASSRLGVLAQPYCLLRETGMVSVERIFKELSSTWSLKKTCYEMRSIANRYQSP